MIYIGTDIVKISRIEQIISKQGQRFLSHIFTDNEQSTCDGKVSPNIHYGGKFAAKEAVKKALLSSRRKKNIPFSRIEIQNKEDGSPLVILRDETGRLDDIHVSISHTDDYAIATAILEIK